MTDLLTYVDIDGVLTRRGAYVPPPPPDIVARDFENLSVANPISAADLRYALGDPSLGDSAAARAYQQLVDLGGTEGKVIRHTYSATYGQGIGYAQVKLIRQPTGPGIIQKFRGRFGTGFETAKGGKIFIGIGGWTPTAAPVSPYTSPSYPTSGGNTSPYAWSARCEWGADGKIHELLYLPTRANYTAGSTIYGIGRTLSGPAWVKGQFYDYERRITLNTATHTNTSTDPRTLVQGTLNPTTGLPNGDGDYYANGLHEVYIDGVQVYRKTNEIFRYFAVNNWGLLWSWFRGGGDATWNATAGGSYADFASHSLEDA